MPDHNFTLSGDEARVFMVSLASSSAAVSTATTVSLWSRLSEISQVQPPVTKEETSNE